MIPKRHGPELPDVMPSHRGGLGLLCYRYSATTIRRRHLSRWDSSKQVMTYGQALSTLVQRGNTGDVYQCGDHWHVTKRNPDEPIPTRRRAKKEKVVTAKTLRNRRARAAKKARKEQKREQHFAKERVDTEAYLQKYMARPVDKHLTRADLHERWGWS